MSLEHGVLDQQLEPGSVPARGWVPNGLLAMAAMADGLDLATGTGAFNVAACWLIAAGVVAGVLAAPFHWIDRTRLPADARARRRSDLRGAAHLVVLGLFAASWALRIGEAAVPASAFVLSLAAAVGLALTTAWLRFDVFGPPNPDPQGDRDAQRIDQRRCNARLPAARPSAKHP